MLPFAVSISSSRPSCCLSFAHHLALVPGPIPRFRTSFCPSWSDLSRLISSHAKFVSSCTPSCCSPYELFLTLSQPSCQVAHRPAGPVFPSPWSSPIIRPSVTTSLSIRRSSLSSRHLSYSAVCCSLASCNAKVNQHMCPSVF